MLTYCSVGSAGNYLGRLQLSVLIEYLKAVGGLAQAAYVYVDA